MAKSAAAVAKKWSRNVGAATESMKEGIQAVTQNPAEKAIARADAYAAGVQRAVSEGRYQDGLRRVTLQSWKTAMIEKGVGRVAAGAQQAEGKMTEFMTEFLPFVEQGQRELESMPRGSLEQNIARANAMMRHNASFRRSRR